MKSSLGFKGSVYIMCAVWAALLIVLTSPLNVYAAPAQSKFVVEDGEWVWRKGGELLEIPSPHSSEETEQGAVYWLVMDSRNEESMKDEKNGVYFYSDFTKKYSFLPLDEEMDRIDGFSFSPDGERFIILRVGGEHSNSYSLYTFADLSSRFEFRAEYGPVWVDSARFVYSRYEPGTSRGMPEDYADEWVSLVLYDVLAEEETILKAATKTSNFSFSEVNEEGDIVAEESWVESPEDWADPENKVKTREVVVPVPAAG